VGNAGAEKAQKINKAMIAYLQRAEAHNAFMSHEIAEFEIGKRHLANIMGVNPDEFTQDDIDAAIEYLLPSGLFDKKARPKMKHPTEALPQRKAAQFGLDGRPFHCFFYTGKPNYVEAMHDLSRKLEALRARDVVTAAKKTTEKQEPKKLQLTGSEWLDKKAVEKIFQELLSDNEYEGLVNLLEFMSKQVWLAEEQETIFKYRRMIHSQTFDKELEPVKKDENGRVYQECIGSRRHANARVRLYETGTGRYTVNGMELLEYFPSLADRRQVIFPLHFTNKLGLVDFDATVEAGGSVGQAGAVRLALSRALRNFVSGEVMEKMRLAGLLTRDPRQLERQKYGQQGARRKYTWKKR